MNRSSDEFELADSAAVDWVRTFRHSYLAPHPVKILDHNPVAACRITRVSRKLVSLIGHADERDVTPKVKTCAMHFLGAKENSYFIALAK
jgi:hypothetical protein